MGLRNADILTFDQQVIFEYLLSNNDNVITEGTDNIIFGCDLKGIESKRVTLMPGKRSQNANRGSIMEAANWIKGPFRLYLRGHGDWQMKTLGGRAAGEVSGDFGLLGKYDKCKLISIVGCELALSEKANGTGVSTNSFAKEFHRLISSGGTLQMTKYIPVFARTKTVSVTNLEIMMMSKKAREHGWDGPLRIMGSKSSGDSKKVFFWKDGKQMMADATLANATDAALGLAEFADFGEEV
jgi:hypothetical protein